MNPIQNQHHQTARWHLARARMWIATMPAHPTPDHRRGCLLLAHDELTLALAARARRDAVTGDSEVWMAPGSTPPSITLGIQVVIKRAIYSAHVVVDYTTRNAATYGIRRAGSRRRLPYLGKITRVVDEKVREVALAWIDSPEGRVAIERAEREQAQLDAMLVEIRAERARREAST